MTELIIAGISLVSIFVSGIFAYKSRLLRSKSADTKVLIQAESEFRRDLLEQIDKLRGRITSLEEGNERLRVELIVAEGKIKELEYVIAQNYNKMESMEGFCEYMCLPAWIETEGVIACVNDFYTREWGFSYGYCVGKTVRDLWGQVAQEFEDANDKVTNLKMGIITQHELSLPFNIESPTKTWNVMRFPIIEHNEVIAIGGIAYPA